MSQPEIPPEWPSWLQRQPERSAEDRSKILLLRVMLAFWVFGVGVFALAVLFLEGMEGDAPGSSAAFWQTMAVGVVGVAGLVIALCRTDRNGRPH